MKEPKDLLFPKGFSEVDDLKKKEMQRPKLKKEKELTPIESFNNKLGELFKINTGVSEEKKRKIGIIITTLIILTIVISAYYFLIFEPTQQALNEAK